MKMTYLFAGRRVSVETAHDYTHRLCMGYECQDEPELFIKVSEEEVRAEQERSDREARAEGKRPEQFDEGYLESLAVYRKLSRELLGYDVLLIHGSVVAVDGEGYLFTAKSGTGKSTHTRLWRQIFGDRAVMVNDDKPLIKVEEGRATVYGTPWNGKHRLGSNIAVPLKAICVLERGEENHIERADFRKIYPLIVQQTYRCSDPEGMAKTLSLLDRLEKAAGFYRLSCNMDPEAAEVAYEGMNRK